MNKIKHLTKAGLRTISLEGIGLTVFCTTIFICLFIFSISNPMVISHDHLVKQSIGFISGKLYLIDPSTHLGDVAKYKDHYYLFYGPIPSVVLVPIVLIYKNFNQQLLVIPCMLLSIFCFYKTFFKLSQRRIVALYLLAALYLGTFFTFLSLVSITAYTIQVLAISMLSISFYFYFVRKNMFLTSIFFTLAFLTRSVLALAIIFFLIEILFSHHTKKEKFIQLVSFSFPVAIGVLGMFGFNYARFGSVFDGGYGYNISDTNTPMFQSAREVGFFSFMHAPGNFYYGFLKTLEPIYQSSQNHILKFPYFKANPSGVSMFLTSPFFIYIFRSNLKEKFVASSVITILVMLLANLTYFSSGTWTYGYRYGLDYYPFIFILLALVFRHRFSLFPRLLIIFAILFNSFFLFSIWDMYPFVPSFLLP